MQYTLKSISLIVIFELMVGSPVSNALKIRNQIEQDATLQRKIRATQDNYKVAGDVFHLDTDITPIEPISDSSILINQDDKDYVMSLLPQIQNASRIFQATVDGWDLSDFTESFEDGPYLALILDKDYGTIYGVWVPEFVENANDGFRA